MTQQKVALKNTSKSPLERNAKFYLKCLIFPKFLTEMFFYNDLCFLFLIENFANHIGLDRRKFCHIKSAWVLWLHKFVRKLIFFKSVSGVTFYKNFVENHKLSQISQISQHYFITLEGSVAYKLHRPICRHMRIAYLFNFWLRHFITVSKVLMTLIEFY